MLYAVVHLLFWRANDSDKTALGTSEYDRCALLLMSEELLILKYLGAALANVRAAEHQFRKKIARHTVHAIKLTLLAAVGTRVRVLLEPVRLAVTAQRLLACFALNRVLEHIITDATDELRQECLNVRLVEYLVFFEDKLLVLPPLVNYTFHLSAVSR